MVTVEILSLNPLKSGHCFNVVYGDIYMTTASLNPLKSGHCFNAGYFKEVAKPSSKSQSPQIGSLFQYKLTTNNQAEVFAVSIPSNRVIVSIKIL